MVQVNVREAKDNFSRLLAMVETGEEVVIARNGVPVAMLVPVEREALKPHLGQSFDQLREDLRGHYLASVERNRELYERLDD